MSPLFGRSTVAPTAWAPLDDLDAEARDRLVKCSGSFAEMVAAGFTLTINTSTTVKKKAADLAETARLAELAIRR